MSCGRTLISGRFPEWSTEDRTQQFSTLALSTQFSSTTVMARVCVTTELLDLVAFAKKADFFSAAEVAHLDKDIELKSFGLPSLLAVKKYIEENPECGKSISACFAGQKQSPILQFDKQEKVQEVDEAAIEEKQQRKARLERIQQTKEYNQMVFGSQNDPVAECRDKEMSAFVSYRHQASVGANVIISAGGMGVVFYFMSQSFLEKRQHVSDAAFAVAAVRRSNTFFVAHISRCRGGRRDDDTGNDTVYPARHAY